MVSALLEYVVICTDFFSLLSPASQSGLGATANTAPELFQGTEYIRYKCRLRQQPRKSWALSGIEEMNEFVEKHRSDT